MQGILTRKHFALLTAWIFVFVTVFQPLLAAGAPRTAPSEKASKKEQNQKDIDLMNNTVASLTELQKRIKRTGFDVDARAKELGPDINEIFQFVRDEIRYEIYLGILRGAKGTLMSLAGNSFDQSTLLAKLLNANKFTVRFAQGILDDGKANMLFSQMFRTKTLQADGTPKFNNVRSDLKRLGVDMSKFKLSYAESNLARMGFEEEIFEDASEDFAYLVKELRSSGLKLEGDRKKSHEKMLAESKAHLWVQVRKGGRWIDLDPSFSEAKVGERFAKSEKILDFEIFLSSRQKTSRKQERELFHHVSFEIQIESLKGKELEKKTLLKKTFRTSDLAGRSILIVNVPNIQIKEPDFSKEIQRVNAFMPLLQIDDDNFFDKGFGLEGQVFNSSRFSPHGEMAATLRGGFGGIGDILGRRLGGSSPKQSKSQLTGQWLKMTLSSPGEKDKEYVREVFDGIGVEKRERQKSRSYQIKSEFKDKKRLRMLLLGYQQLLIEPGFSCGKFAINELVAKLRKVSEFVLTDLRAKAGLVQVNERDRSLKNSEIFKSDMLGELLTLSCEVRRLGRRIGAAQYPGTSFYRSIPGIVIFRTEFDIPPGKKPVIRRGFDIVENAFQVVAEKDQSNAFLFNLFLGVLQTHMEKKLALELHESFVQSERSVGESGKFGNEIPASSMIGVFEAARTSGIKTTLLGQGSAEGLAALKVSPEAKARIRQEIGKGNLVLVPEKSVTIAGKKTVGWWRIDPQKGTTLGIMESGRGQAIPEREIMHIIWNVVARSMFEYGKTLLKIHWKLLFCVATIYACVAASGEGVGLGGAVCTGSFFACKGR